jgi:hypothetical protein
MKRRRNNEQNRWEIDARRVGFSHMPATIVSVCHCAMPATVVCACHYGVCVCGYGVLVDIQYIYSTKT